MLAKRTYKGTGLEVAQRVYYVLSDDKKYASHRAAKALSLIVAKLVEKGVLSAAELDELLLECA
jgi:hypothetical protein